MVVLVVAVVLAIVFFTCGRACSYSYRELQSWVVLGFVFVVVSVFCRFFLFSLFLLYFIVCCVICMTELV